MLDELGAHHEQSGCPMQQIKSDSEEIKKKTHEALGKPTLILDNNLAGVEGGKVPSFLEDFQLKSLNNLVIEGLDKIISISIIGMEGELDNEDEDIMVEQEDPIYMSKLAYILYSNFIESYKYIALDRAEFYMLSLAFFQAFDSVLLSGTMVAENNQRWLNIRQDMLDTLINLTQISTNLQERMTCPTIQSDIYFSTEAPYALMYMKESWNLLKCEDNFTSLLEWIDEDKGGYGKCPAAEDGTLLKAFDILFEIYGDLLVKPKEEKQLQST